MTAGPILAVDIDGVLNAISGGPPPEGWQDTKVKGFRIRYNPAHGAQLLALAAECQAELIWCTTWQEMANQYIRHLVGLPELPWVPMGPGRSGLKPSEYRPVGAMKAAAMRAYVGDRPFCWLDDEPDAADELRTHPAPHLVVYVHEEMGLQDGHLAQARAWLASLPRQTGSQGEPQ